MQPSESTAGSSAPGERDPSSAERARDDEQVGANAAGQDGLPEEDMGRLMADADSSLRTLRRGEMLEGVVISVDRDGVLVDIGTKSEGIIPASEVQKLVDESGLNVGDLVYVVVVQPDGPDDHAVLSLNRARSERGWGNVQTAVDAGTIVSARVLEVTRGGLVVEVEGLRGFIPLGQIASVRVSGLTGQDLDNLLATMVGQEISVKVLEVNRRRNRLILSERLAVQEMRGQRKERLLTELHDGEIRQGRVSSLSDFGAFVDLGGADGLVHLSELAWHQVGHPSEVVSVGEEVQVLVLGVDRERGKISLSLRRTQPEPWATASERYPVGSLVTGRVARLTTFGAFVRLDDSIEGLIHVSELSSRHVVHPRNVVKEGDVVTVRVLRVEPERRRLGLSLRQAEEMDQVAEGNFTFG